MQSESREMSFLERSIWAQLLTTIIVYALYFTGYFKGWLGGGVRLFIAACIVQTVLIVLCHAAFKRKAPPEPKDERDLEIDRRSSRVAYLLLICLLVLLILISLGAQGETFFPEPARLANAVLFCVVFSEIVRYTIQGVSYRRAA